MDAVRSSAFLTPEDEIVVAPPAPPSGTPAFDGWFAIHLGKPPAVSIYAERDELVRLRAVIDETLAGFDAGRVKR